MTSTEVYLKSDSRDEQLLNSVRQTLERQKYSWHDNPVLLKPGVAPATNSLKELLITNSVEMEATTDTNVTALCTVDTEPVDSIESYERLCQFCEDCPSPHKTELSQILYPVFVHVYLDLIAGGHSGMAESFFNKFSMVIGSTHQSELKELSDVVSAEQVSASSLVKKFRSQKYFLRMSSKAFQLLMQFLQVCQTPGLLSLIQRYLAIDVYGDNPVSIAEGTGKSEQKKGAHSLTFVKPKIPQLEARPQITTSSRGSAVKELKLPDPNQVVSLSFGKIEPDPSARFEQVTSTFTLASSEESGSSTTRTDLRERLAVCSQQLTPSPPSVALYTVHTPHSNSAHCACLSPSSDMYACGFADSSIHLWSRLPVDPNQTSPNCPIKLQSDHHVLRGQHGPVYGISFDKSGRYLLSCSEDCSVRLWDTHTRHSLVSYRGHTLPVWDTVFSPVDVYFASASLDRTARLWTTDLVFPLRVLAGHTASVDVVRFHCNGKYVATGSCDRTCRLWDVQTGSCVRLMACCKAPISSLAFSPNGKQLVSGDKTGTVRIWDLGSGSVVNEYSEATPTTRRCLVSSLVFSSDSTLLVSSNHDNKISIRSMKALEQSTMTAQQSLSKEAVSQLSCNVDQLLHLEFTHRNCLVAIGADSSTASSNQMDTT